MLTKLIYNGKEINLTSDNISIKSNQLEIQPNGSMTLKGGGGTSSLANIRLQVETDNTRDLKITPGYLQFKNNTRGEELYIASMSNGLWFRQKSGSAQILMLNDGNDFIQISLTDGINTTTITPNRITTPVLQQSSKESIKKNIQKSNDALKIVKNSEIYTYNLKSEQGTDKKHYGFIIPDLGGNYKTPDEVISQDGQGIESYTMCSILWKAVQELTEKVEQLEKERDK